MAYGLTPREAAVLRYIAGYLERHNGLAPSYDEITQHCVAAKSSRSAVHEVVRALCERGYLARLERKRRSLSLTDSGAAWWVAEKALWSARRALPPPPVCSRCGSGWLHDGTVPAWRPTCACEDVSFRPAEAA